MHQQISKKILIYLFIFLFLGTFNNRNFLILNFPKIKNFEINGLNDFESKKIHKDLFEIKNQNLFFLQKDEIIEKIKSHKIIEKFYVFKNYPSNLYIKIEKTNFVAITKKNNLNFYIGSNGNLIEAKNKFFDIPFVFGNVDIEEFLKLKKIIDESDLNYKDIKNFYYFNSSRWDIETKNELLIKLPRNKLKKSFDVLFKIYEKNEFKNLKLIDLRQDRQVIVNG